MWDRRGSIEEMALAYWILQCNPDRWRIREFFAAGEILRSWTITRYLDRVAKGDRFALWLSGPRGGVVGLGDVVGAAVQFTDGVDDGYWREPVGAGAWSLPIQLTRLFLDRPLTSDELAHDPRFATSAILRQPFAGNPFRLGSDEWTAILEGLDDRVGSSFVPAEATGGATTLLRRLVGQPLTTVTAKVNTIVAVRPPEVWVATQRSPKGQPVPIEEVDQALTALTATGRLEIHPRTVGHRSSFIGAVLLTLPGARHYGTPPVIELSTPDDLSAAAGDYTFEGDLTRETLAAGRGEQATLRQRLFADASTSRCALCGDLYPVEFLRAAHIKKRSACTDHERRDLDHIAMPACMFGCDSLCEAGFITVAADGRIRTTKNNQDENGLAAHLSRLNNRIVGTHAPATAGYFAWHHDTIYRG
jgi:hypothetical protein